MKKTAIEWYQDLPEPYRTEAIENFKDDDLRFCNCDLKTEFSNLKAALIIGFEWTESPQGLDYWDKVYNTMLLDKAPSEWTKFDADDEGTFPKDGRYICVCKTIKGVSQIILDFMDDGCKMWIFCSVIAYQPLRDMSEFETKTD